jgi:hypothetical protein
VRAATVLLLGLFIVGSILPAAVVLAQPGPVDTPATNAAKIEVLSEKAKRDAEIDAIVAAVAKAVAEKKPEATSEIPLGPIVIVQAFALVGLIVKEWFGQRANRERHDANVKSIEWIERRQTDTEKAIGLAPDPAAPIPAARVAAAPPRKARRRRGKAA